MAEYEIVVPYKITQSFSVEADSEDEAIGKVSQSLVSRISSEHLSSMKVGKKKRWYIHEISS